MGATGATRTFKSKLRDLIPRTVGSFQNSARLLDRPKGWHLETVSAGNSMTFVPCGIRDHAFGVIIGQPIIKPCRQAKEGKGNTRAGGK